jgi:hypothetical protein
MGKAPFFLEFFSLINQWCSGKNNNITKEKGALNK